MIAGAFPAVGSAVGVQHNTDALLRHAAWFHELDAWTEYWDIYHPETRGRFYFGDGALESGLLTHILPRERRPPAFQAWTRMVLSSESECIFRDQVRRSPVAQAVTEVDGLVSRIFGKYFGDPANPAVQADYLEAVLCFAMDALPPAYERARRVPEDDWRSRTAGRHTLDGDLMWFAWSLHLEAAHAIVGEDGEHARRALQLAGVAVGCSANFAWRGHRRTRPEYDKSASTLDTLRRCGARLATDFDAAAREVHSLFRIREWGHE